MITLKGRGDTLTPPLMTTTVKKYIRFKITTINLVYSFISCPKVYALCELWISNDIAKKQNLINAIK